MLDTILDWWMFHDAAPLALTAGIGVWLAMRQHRRGLAAVMGLFLGALALSLLPGLQSLNRLLAAEHWLVLAAIVAACAHRDGRSPGLASLAPLLLATQGFGALMLGITIAGKALLEPGAKARGWLVVALAMLALASLMDGRMLRLWELARTLLELGADPASLLVRVLIGACRLAGWGAILRWSYSSPPVSCGASPAWSSLAQRSSKLAVNTAK